MSAQVIDFPVERMAMHVKRRLAAAGGPGTVRGLRKLDRLRDLIDGLRAADDSETETSIRQTQAALDRLLEVAVARAIGVA